MSGVLLFVHPVSAGTWSCPATTGDKPLPCAHFTLTKVDDSRVVMFGGWTGIRFLNDVYILDVKQWVCYYYVMDADVPIILLCRLGLSVHLEMCHITIPFFTCL